MADNDAIWHRYLAWYLSTLLLFCALVAGINTIIDPEARILIVDRPGFNQIKIALSKNDRKGKATALRQCEYNTVVLGTSRAETGIAMNHPALSDAKPYNAALKAASMYEMRRMTEYAMRHQDLNIVIFGLDLISFSTNATYADDFADSPLAESIPLASLGRYLVSIRTLRESLATLQQNWQGNAVMCGDNGEYKSKQKAEEARSAFNFILGSYAKGQYNKFTLSDPHIKHMADLLRQLRDKGVTVYAFITPAHVTHLELMTEMGLIDAFDNWKRELVQVFTEANQGLPDQPQAVLWDFSGYTEITTENIPSPEVQKYMRWYIDSAHFRQNAGDMIIDRMLGRQTDELTAIGDFGVQLSADNIETVIAARRHGSERYRREHADEIQNIQRILQLADPTTAR